MKKRLWILVLISIIFTIYTVADTLALFESSIEAYTEDINPAKWTIKLNSQDISEGRTIPIKIINMNYNSGTNVESGYIAPGTSGYFTLTLDATSSEVAVKFDITFDMDSMEYEDNITFNVTKKSGTVTTVKTGPNTYTGVLSLSDISGGNGSVEFKVEVEWADDSSGDYDDKDTELGTKMFQKLEIPIIVHAEQYLDETITPYVE